MALDTDNALITLDEARTWLSFKAGETDYDSIVEQIIDSVSWAFNRYTNRKLKARDLTEYYDGDGTVTLYVANYPINSVTSVHIDADRAYGSDTEVASDDYILYGTVGKIVLDGEVWSTYPKANKIVYNGGYSAIPYDIKKACLDQVKHEFKRWKGNNENVRSQTAGDGSVVYFETNILSTVKTILDRYVNRHHAVYG